MTGYYRAESSAERGKPASGDDYRYLGVANGWGETPPEVVRCRQLGHQTSDAETRNQYHVVTCDECGYSFEYDCSG